jgi:hypothetical protein
MKDKQSLIRAAQQILDNNWRDGYTIPSAKLYPFQWNWDSGFIAIGHIYNSQQRAKEEIQHIFKGQWENGLLPHIVFHKENENYYPGSDVWQIENSPYAPKNIKTSGIVQPPVFGFILEMLYDISKNKNDWLVFCDEIFPLIEKYHKYLYTARDINNEGLVYIQHNWESGTDNSPTFDDVLAKIKIEKDSKLTHLRRDLKNVDKSERPSDGEYQRYLALVALFAKNNYDDLLIAQNSPFLIQDPLFSALLIRSNRGLIRMGELLNKDTSHIKEWNELSISNMNNKLWNEETYGYDSFDLNSGKKITNYSSSAYIPALFAEIPDKRRTEQMITYLKNTFCKDTHFCCPSYLYSRQEFETKCYWRGPVWINMNWMLYKALIKIQDFNFAKKILNDSISLIKEHGFFEYFDPRKKNGAGYGTDNFSWSAALLIDLLHSESHE